MGIDPTERRESNMHKIDAGAFEAAVKKQEREERKSRESKGKRRASNYPLEKISEAEQFALPFNPRSTRASVAFQVSGLESGRAVNVVAVPKTGRSGVDIFRQVFSTSGAEKWVKENNARIEKIATLASAALQGAGYAVEHAQGAGPASKGMQIAGGTIAAVSGAVKGANYGLSAYNTATGRDAGTSTQAMQDAFASAAHLGKAGLGVASAFGATGPVMGLGSTVTQQLIDNATSSMTTHEAIDDAQAKIAGFTQYPMNASWSPDQRSASPAYSNDSSQGDRQYRESLIYSETYPDQTSVAFNPIDYNPSSSASRGADSWGSSGVAFSSYGPVQQSAYTYRRTSPGLAPEESVDPRYSRGESSAHNYNYSYTTGPERRQSRQADSTEAHHRSSRSSKGKGKARGK
ncbi:hypothetical protein [Streptomyces sp. DSM 40484]|uniref:hypothetical protein n=1 Tax=Streptomyces kroppenstedtii TaxID=3051181 RepID=UPI0028D664EB|nr:hypothetical protein [Streptomyces sp. DSM 40484]